MYIYKHTRMLYMCIYMYMNVSMCKYTYIYMYTYIGSTLDTFRTQEWFMSVESVRASTNDI